MENPTFAQRMKPFIPVAAGVLVFLLIYFFVLTRYDAESNVEVKEFGIKDVTANPDYMAIPAKLVSVDPVKGELTTRLQFFPQGALLDEADGTLKEPIIIDLNSETGKTELSYKKGDRINPIDIVVSLYDGDVMRYPFDEHSADLSIGTFMVPAVKEGEEKEFFAIPAKMDFGGALPGYTISAEETAKTEEGYLEVGITINRAPTSIFFAVFIMVLMGLLAIVALSVSLTCLVTGRKIEATLFSWMGALLFAMVPLRNAMPGVPPIGALTDYISFFWAEILVALSLVIFVYTYLSRPWK